MSTALPVITNLASDLLNTDNVFETTVSSVAIAPFGSGNVAIAWLAQTTSGETLYVANVTCSNIGIGSYTKSAAVTSTQSGLPIKNVGLYTDPTSGTVYLQYQDGAGIHLCSSTDLVTFTPITTFTDPTEPSSPFGGVCGSAPSISVLFYLRNNGAPQPTIVSLANNGSAGFQIWDTGSFPATSFGPVTLASFANPITYQGQLYGNAAAFVLRTPLGPIGYVLPDYWGNTVTVATTDLPSGQVGLTSWSNGATPPTTYLVEAFAGFGTTTVNVKLTADMKTWASAPGACEDTSVKWGVQAANSGGYLYVVYVNQNSNIRLLQYGVTGG